MTEIPRQVSAVSAAEEAVKIMASVLRNRGLTVTEGELPGSLRVSAGARSLVIRHIAKIWYRPLSGDESVLQPVGRVGAEDPLARHLANELVRGAV